MQKHFQDCKAYSDLSILCAVYRRCLVGGSRGLMDRVSDL